MRLSIFNSKVRKISFVGQCLLLCLTVMIGYQVLIFSGLISPSEGIHQAQSNFIRAEKYVYSQTRPAQMVLVGSSLTANLESQIIGSDVFNLAMRGGCTQTGLEIVRKKSSKPKIILVEVNETIQRELDGYLIDSLYNPFLYFMRSHFPMFKQEYRPVSVLVDSLRKWSQGNQESGTAPDSPLRLQEIERVKKQFSNPLSDETKALIIEQAQVIKNQLLAIGSQELRIVLFNVPGEPGLETTVKKQEIEELIETLFPSDRFEWLPNPQREWKTSDGVHLTQGDAQEYAVYLREQLLDPISG